MKRRTGVLSIGLLLVGSAGESALARNIDFVAPRAFAAPTGHGVELTEILRGDFDEDGLFDVVVAGYDRTDGRATEVYLFRGDAVRGFDAPVTITATTADAFGKVTDLSRGDFNEDGHLDLAVLQTYGLRILLGDGRGRFPRESLLGLVERAQASHPIDVNEDGHVDLLIAVDPRDFLVLLGDGTGDLLFSHWMDAAQPSAFDLADFDGDGHVDIVVGHGQRKRTTVQLGDGAGSFTQSWEDTEFIRPTGIVTGDFDGDGSRDFVILGVARNLFAIGCFRGDGNGRFTLGAFISSPYSTWLSSADFDEDGLPDVVAQGSTWTIAFGDPSAGLARARTIVARSTPDKATTGDFDRDGHADIVYITERSNQFALVRGDGRGGLEEPIAAAAPDDGRMHTDVTMLDLDRDGFADAVGSGMSPSRPTLFLYRGNASGRLVESGRIPDTGGGNIARGDFDEDGILDVAVRTLGPTFNGREILFGDGLGGFRAQRSRGPGGSESPDIVLDADGDGHLDLVALLESYDVYTPGYLSISFGNGSGSFLDVGSIRVGRCANTISAADFDGDGSMDYVIGKCALDAIIVVRGRGRSLPEVVLSLVLSDGAPAFGPAAGDFDEDGHADVAALAPEDRLVLFRGNGAFGFDPVETTIESLGATSRFNALQAVELDHDGHLDLAGATFVAGRLFALMGNGSGSFSAPVSFDTAGGGRAFDFGDVNGDGEDDLVYSLATLWSVNGRALDPVRPRRGLVNAGTGLIADVLFVNGSRGRGDERRFELLPSTPIALRVATPPSRSGRRAKFALYLWVGALPSRATVNDLPLGLGVACLPMPITPERGPQPRFRWNNAGRPDLLGAASLPSQSAPTTLFDRPGGTGRAVTLFFQGIITDPAAPNGKAAVTNAIEVVAR